MARAELVATYWTIAGDVWIGGPTEVSQIDFRTRVEAARKAGYTGIGLIHADVMAVSGKIGFAEMDKILADNGMTIREVEIISDWYADGDRLKQSNKVRDDLLRAADKLKARHIKICGDIHQGDWPMPRMIETFAGLCADAAKVGTRIALELMPFTNIKTVEQGLAIVQGAGAKNGGLLLDIWHIARGKIPYDRLKTIPKECITWIEIDDADAEVKGSLWDDTLFHRKLCGEGVLNVPAFLQAIKATGYDDAYGVEIISEIHRKRPLDEMATRSFDAAIKQFDLVK